MIIAALNLTPCTMDAVCVVLAYLVAALSPNMDVANAALPTYVVTLLFFAGLLMTYNTMPPWWKWYSYIDFVRYSWGALVSHWALS